MTNNDARRDIPVSPHRATTARDAYVGVASAPDDRSQYQEAMRRATWRHFDHAALDRLTNMKRIERYIRSEGLND